MKVQVLVGADVYQVEVDDSARKLEGTISLGLSAGQSDQSLVPQLSRQAFDSSKDAKVCRSPLAGIVARVNVAAGQQVAAGDVMLVVEAMKMETTISAPAAVTTKAVKVAPGDVVKLNQVLLEFE